MCVANRYNHAWKECRAYLNRFDEYCLDFLAKGNASKISRQMIKNIKKLTRIYFLLNENISKRVLDSLTYKRCLNKLERLDEKESTIVSEDSISLFKKSELLLQEEKEMLSIRYMEKDDDVITYSEDEVELMKYYSDKVSITDLKKGSFEYFIQNLNTVDKIKLFVSFKPDGLPVLVRVKNNSIKKLIYITEKGIIEINPSVFEGKIHIKDNIPDCILKMYLVLPYEALPEISRRNDRKYKNTHEAIRDLFIYHPEERRLFYKYIEFIPYDILFDDKDYFDLSKKAKLDTMKLFNTKYMLKTFILNKNTNNIVDEIEGMIDFLIDEKYKLQYSSSNIIIEPNKKSISRKLGISNGIYNFRVIYKLPSALRETVVRDMITTVGHTGKVNCVICYEPVEFDGRTFDRSSIGSAILFEKLRLKKGDRIKVFYSNDRLATIFSNVDRDNNDGKYIKFPKKCPRCQSKLEDIGANLYCRNLDCPEITIRKITNFVNRLNISYIAYQGISTLYDLNQVKKYSDIFNLSSLILSCVPNFGAKKAGRVKQEIAILKDRKVSESELLYALSIDNLGPKAAKLICSKFRVKDLLYRNDYEFLYNTIPELRGYNIDFSFLQKNSEDIEKVVDILA